MKIETYNKKTALIFKTYRDSRLDEARHLAKRIVKPAIQHHIQDFWGCDRYTAHIISNYLKTGTGLYWAIEAEKEFKNKKLKIINKYC